MKKYLFFNLNIECWLIRTTYTETYKQATLACLKIKVYLLGTPFTLFSKLKANLTLGEMWFLISVQLPMSALEWRQLEAELKKWSFHVFLKEVVDIVFLLYIEEISSCWWSLSYFNYLKIWLVLKTMLMEEKHNLNWSFEEYQDRHP